MLPRGALLFLILIVAAACEQSPPIYKNPEAPISARVEDLLGRMSKEEKFWQLFMIPGDLSEGKANYSNGIFGLQIRGNSDATATEQLMTGSALATARKVNAIQRYFVKETRLGVPIIAFEEALHGLIAEGATSYPVPIALAATWDTVLMAKVASAIAAEARSRGIRDVLSPVVNIATDSRWGRTEETYGEDPFLSSAMGAAFVQPFEAAGIVTTPKHFIANIGDGGRDSYPIDYNERLLEEIYLPPFRACITRGGSRSIMTSYNSVNGSPSSANKWLLKEKLMGDMGFRGFVISDAGAIGGANVLHMTAANYEEATINAMKNGAHVIFQTSWEHHKLFIPPFLDGRIDEELIDSAVARVLRVKFELGLFENPFVDESEAARIDQSASQALAKDAALRSIVLLKNEDNALPLKKDIRSIAVIGVDAVDGRLGGYSRPGQAIVPILAGIRGKLGEEVEVIYSQGCGRASSEFVPVSSDNLIGLKGDYFNNIDLTGAPVLSRNENNLDFRWTLFGPDPRVNFDFFSVRWTGKLRSPGSGKYRIGLEGNNGYRLFIDDKPFIDNWKSQSYTIRVAEFSFEKDRVYDIRAEFFESSGGSRIRLVWDAEVDHDWQGKLSKAAETASGCDATIVVVGIEEGEGLDRAHLGLPGKQEEMIRRIAATGKPVVVVIVGGSAVTMKNWIDNVEAVLEVWYPGDQGGEAVADVLSGDFNPAGRLPVSFPVFEGQLPFVYNHKPTGRNDDYGDMTGQPLFPFGFGLSYTTFAYSDLRFDKQSIGQGETTSLRFKLKNTGDRDGDEVVQLYIRDEVASVAQPVKQLKGFQRVLLKAGEEKEVVFSIAPDLLGILNEDLVWVVEPGDFRIMIGSSSRDIRLRDHLKVIP